MAPKTPDAHVAPGARAEITTRIAEAAVETLKTRGFAGASAREIAKTGQFNQALIFYHFGGVQNALLAGLDLVSDRRMQAYGAAFEAATTLPELASLAARIYHEDLANGYVTVLVEMVAGAVSDPDLGREVADRIDPWLEMVEAKVSSVIEGLLFAPLVPARDIAFAIVALYLGVDMLSHLDRNRTSAQSLLDLGVRISPLAQAFLPTRSEETR